MIPYSRDSEKTIPPSAVKIIGLGGAGANMLERIALDGMEGTELLALNTDIRTLGACIAKEKIQLGKNLTKGLGTGGDPELGHKAVLEAEEEIRASLKGRKIVFICTGLGGGTGSGAAPIVTRIAREEGAFVVVFATIPFAFEGQRRREQAETTLNELAVLSNALMTFDNNRMGELVLAKQGIHEAFVAADHMIAESIKSVIRLVVRPGLINVGLDDLMSALKTNRSRCLFGSGKATGKDRASKALRHALASPLLDQGTLLKEAQTVLVHLCGGEDLTLFEVELLMQQLQKHVPVSAHVLFGAAIDPAMANTLSITLISALPEESLAMAPRESLSQAEGDSPLLHAPPSKSPETPLPSPAKTPPPVQTEPEPPSEPEPAVEEEPIPAEAISAVIEEEGAPEKNLSLFNEERPFAEADDETPTEAPPFSINPSPDESAADEEPEELQELAPLEEPDEPASTASVSEFSTSEPATDEAPEFEQDDELEDDKLFTKPPGFQALPEKRQPGEVPWSPKPKSEKPELDEVEAPTPAAEEAPATNGDEPEPAPDQAELDAPETHDADDADHDSEIPKLKLGVKSTGKPQNELGLDTTPRGRFEGENPNVFEGEDLDLPPFLRKKK